MKHATANGDLSRITTVGVYFLRMVVGLERMESSRIRKVYEMIGVGKLVLGVNSGEAEWISTEIVRTYPKEWLKKDCLRNVYE